MKSIVLAAAALVVAAPAIAQTADHSMHAGHADAAAKFSLDTPIATLVADEKAKAVLDANLPGLTTHEHYEMFKGMTLNQIAPMAGDRMPATALAKTKADLAAIK
ncbi:hypothetical protein [Tsuneonella amylolytica]|uniref:hypothetical protein n=1 Tax=Tsuneonella amylolytica TaxID=2338327 RepID=UPI000EA8D89B|nr:hypothetical protein [Tsuneonella amylolytica]